MSFLSKLFGASNKEASATPEQTEANQTRNFNTLRDDGVRAMSMGEIPFAVKCFEAALEIQDDLSVKALLAEALFRLGNYEQARQVLAVLADAEPENTNIILLLARAEGELQMYTEMRQTLNRVKADEAQEISVRYLVAEADFHTGNAIFAVATLTQILGEDAEFLPAYLLRARVLVSMGQGAQAIEDTAHLLELAPENEEVHHLHAQGLLQTGDYDGAEAAARA